MFSFLREAIWFGTVYLYGSTGEIITEKSGHLNLGIPGIMCMGAVGGCVADIWYMNSFADPSKMPAGAVIIIGILGAMLVAGLMGLLYSFFTVSLRCNQNVTGLAITTFGIGVMNYWSERMGAKGISIYWVRQCFAQTFPCAGTIGDFGKLFFSYGTLTYLALAIALIASFVLRRTRIGLNLRAIGENPAAADATGINITAYKYVATVLGAAIAGIGGLFCMVEVTTSFQYSVDAAGWLAVAIVIFSVWRPSLAVLGSMAFAILYYIPSRVQVDFGEKELIKMIPYVVTIIVLIIISILNKKETQPPQSLGVNYFREER
ncbi:MAG: ABC transporter permease [Clostridiales bacterium]|mgnify:FL=1|jgi:simple sugar transport system permease protein|nr:ABC transporter permease [Clostridiales bacterium]MDY4654741.1 ABC transporter permease [Eubacteriales bacterium]